MIFFPGLERVKDPDTKEAIRYLWDNIQRLERQQAGVVDKSSIYAFSAGLGNVEQTGFPSANATRVLMTILDFEIGTPKGQFSNGRFAPALPGLYYLSASVFFETIGVDTLTNVAIAKNGDTSLGKIGTYVVDDLATYGAQPYVTALLTAIPGDFFEVLAFQNSGATRTISGYHYETWFQGYGPVAPTA